MKMQETLNELKEVIDYLERHKNTEAKFEPLDNATTHFTLY